MPASRLFWKLLLVVAGLNVAAGIAFGLIVSRWWQGQILDAVDRRLQDAAFLVSGELADQIGAGPSDALQERVRELARGTGTRFTLIDRRGAVLADSQRETLAEVRAMESHRDRPEIVQARMHGEGASSRISATARAAQRYFALRVGREDQPAGFVRAAMPIDWVAAETAAVRRRVWLLVGAMCLSVLALSWWTLARILRPVVPLTQAADALADGQHRQRLYVDSRDELGALAGALNRISDQLGERTLQLGQTGDRQSVVLEGMIEGVIAIDNRERVVLANRAAGQLFNFRPPGIEGRPLLEVVRSHALHAAVSNALATGQSQRLETRREGGHPEVTRLFVDIHVQPLPGRPCPGAVLVMHDTTELRRLESLRRDFIANVSHELKTPLSSIKAYAETLRNGAVHDAETVQRFLARIEEQADRLHHLIMDMLMLARIESEQQAFEVVPLDVSEAVQRSLEDHRAAAAAKGIEFNVEPGQPGCRVRADREGLREILDNLIDNAIKYTPEGGSVTVGWHQEGPIVQLRVRDTGIGIRPEDQRRVFERFYRVDKARSRELGGTGLGLAIVKHLVQSFGGKVGVESEPGKGSTFVVELPGEGTRGGDGERWRGGEQ